MRAFLIGSGFKFNGIEAYLHPGMKQNIGRGGKPPAQAPGNRNPSWRRAPEKGCYATPQ